MAGDLLLRDDEARLEIMSQGRPWSFNGDGALFRLLTEAPRYRLVRLFDLVLVMDTPQVEPLSHEIPAGYEATLPCQLLGFLLADDRGAGNDLVQQDSLQDEELEQAAKALRLFPGDRRESCSRRATLPWQRLCCSGCACGPWRNTPQGRRRALSGIWNASTRLIPASRS